MRCDLGCVGFIVVINKNSPRALWNGRPLMASVISWWENGWERDSSCSGEMEGSWRGNRKDCICWRGRLRLRGRESKIVEFEIEGAEAISNVLQVGYLVSLFIKKE